VNLQQRHDAGTVDRGSRPSAGRVGLGRVTKTEKISGSGRVDNFVYTTGRVGSATQRVGSGRVTYTTGQVGSGRVDNFVYTTCRVGSGQLHNGSDRVGSRKE